MNLKYRQNLPANQGIPEGWHEFVMPNVLVGTGVMDANGVEIFEGDSVLSSSNFDPDTVVYNKGSFEVFGQPLSDFISWGKINTNLVIHKK